MSYTSAFWAAPLLTACEMPRALFGNLLLRSAEPPSNSVSVVLDGGVVDTTAVIGLLQRRTERVVAFYNNNVPLSKLRSPFAYLFGIDVPTDSMNGLLGPGMQVFPSESYEDVMGNLTDPSIALARLEGVSVVSNPNMGVDSYTLESLVIFSNTKNDNFVPEDERIAKRLSSGWPDGYAPVPPRFDANLLCLFNDWKVGSNHGVLGPILGQGEGP
ncbi:hypothetical protein ACHAWF_009512 [Thalassiosira exigua]